MAVSALVVFGLATASGGNQRPPVLGASRARPTTRARRWDRRRGERAAAGPRCTRQAQHLADQDHVVAGVEALAQAAADVDERAVEPGRAVAARPVDPGPLRLDRVLAGEGRGRSPPGRASSTLIEKAAASEIAASVRESRCSEASISSGSSDRAMHRVGRGTGRPDRRLIVATTVTAVGTSDIARRNSSVSGEVVERLMSDSGKYDAAAVRPVLAATALIVRPLRALGLRQPGRRRSQRPTPITPARSCSPSAARVATASTRPEPRARPTASCATRARTSTSASRTTTTSSTRSKTAASPARSCRSRSSPATRRRRSPKFVANTRATRSNRSPIPGQQESGENSQTSEP